MPGDDRKTIDDIIRTKSIFDGNERMVGRDGGGDFKSLLASIVAYATTGAQTIEIDDADYTVLDTDIAKTFIFKNLTADRNFNFPTLADNFGRSMTIINESDYKVICTPEGTDLINDWNTTFEITEKGGKLDVIGLTDNWKATPNENCCIYRIETESAVNCSLDGTWYDVINLNLTGIYGTGYLSAKGVQVVEDTSLTLYIYGYFGVGKTSGNNAPDIPDAYDFANGVKAIANTLQQIIFTRYIKCKYESDGSVLYMKAQALSNEMNVDAHEMYGIADGPLYVEFRRTR